jgi:hypothetical protein
MIEKPGIGLQRTAVSEIPGFCQESGAAGLRPAMVARKSNHWGFTTAFPEEPGKSNINIV